MMAFARWWDTLPVQTIGQVIYLAVMSNPDGLEPDELIARIQEEKSELSRELILNQTVLLQARGYIRQDQGRWYAPGPETAVWEML